VAIVARPRGAKARAAAAVELLREQYPDARCALDHANAYQLLVATILSAQTTADLASADAAELESIIQSTGFFRSKAKNLIGMAQAVVARFDGEIPVALDDLVTLPGVGRKTGNVVRSVWFHEPGLPVDTHVTRLSARLRLTDETDPVKIERDLGAIVPPAEWGDFSLRLIEHGRRVCDARRPRCSDCGLAGICPSAGKVGGAV
jgi:endonuclease-3